MRNPPDDTAEYIPFEEFRNGLSHGRFHVIVNPKLAPAFVACRIHATPLALATIGPGHRAGALWSRLGRCPPVAAEILFRRAVKWQAGRLPPHRGSHVSAVYDQATSHGVMQVR